MSPFCEICEKIFEYIDDHYDDCIICGQHCCKDCIDKDSICSDCNTIGDSDS